MPQDEFQPQKNLLLQRLQQATMITATTLGLSAIMYMPTPAAFAQEIDSDPKPPRMEMKAKMNLPTNPQELAKLLLNTSRIETVSEFNDLIDFRTVTLENGDKYVFGDMKDLDRVLGILSKKYTLEIKGANLATRLGSAPDKIWKDIKGGLFPEMMAEEGVRSVVFIKLTPNSTTNSAK